MMDVASRSKMITAKRGDRITVKSTSAGHAYLVKEGHLRAVRTAEDGRVLSLDILVAGDVLGITPVMTEDADADAAEALDDVLFCRLPALILREILEQNPGLALHFSKRVGLRRKSLETRLMDIAFCTVKVRLARLLLELSDRFGKPSSGGTLIQLKLTHQELGDMIGSNREAANRAVSFLLDANVVRFSGKNLEIVDQTGLLQEAVLPFDWLNVSTDTA